MRTRFCTFLILMLGLSWTAQAQSNLNFGIRGGVNLATLSGDGADDVDLERRVGLVAGVFFQYPLTPQVSIQPEVLYAMKGAKFSEELLGEEFNATFEFDYIEIPVLLRFEIPTGSSVHPFLVAGPAAAFNIKADLTAEAAGEEESEDFSDEVESFDLGAAFGGGIALTNSLSIDVRYTLGLLNVIADPEEDEGELKNGVLSVAAAFTFGR